MRTIIAGSRSCDNWQDVCDVIELSGFIPTLVLSGKAKGADSMGEYWAKRNSIPIQEYPADWGSYGRGAGFKRNIQMAKNADALIAVWDGVSRGTKHMIDTAKALGLKVFIYNIGEFE